MPDPHPNPPAQTRWQRGFWSLFLTQFQGAFSDNVFKFLVIFLVTGTLLPEQRDRLISISLALFALPFILFSMTGGHLADRFSKRSVIIGTKVAEIGIMLLGMVALARASIPMLLTVIFLMSVQSAIFGPSKYGSLPEILPDSRLSWGNGIIGLGTFAAIILGGVTAGWLSDTFRGQHVWSGALLVALACAGLSVSLGISRVPAANPGKKFQPNFLADVAVQVRGIRQDRVLFLAIIGSMYFWFLGALLDPAILIYGKDVLHLNDQQSSYLRAALAIGIGIGSFAAGWLSGKKIEYGLIPLGAMGLTAFGAALYRPELSFSAVQLNLALLGFFAGFYIVPINALIQHRPVITNKGGVIATNSWLSFVGIFLAAGVYWLLLSVARLSPPEIFLAASIVTLGGTAYAIWLMPDSLLRLSLWFCTHSIYRIRVEGRENIPAKGGALLVCNHLSLVDALLLQASIDRPVRFLMYKGIYDRPWIKPFARIMGVIPISSELRPREMIRSLQAAGEAIQNGELVCIFAEGQITRIGQMLPFRRGFERIMQSVDAPIIPVALDGAWGSVFSFAEGRFFWNCRATSPTPLRSATENRCPAIQRHLTCGSRCRN